MKVVTVVGARPQFIKASMVSRVFSAMENVEEIIVHTGQHFEHNMSALFFEEMHIPTPKYNLNINNLNHGAMTGMMMQRLEEIFIDEKPNWVVIYGDTNSTLAGALAAKKLHIKVAHIEAGLRSFNMEMPEEINRVITDRISDILFCPTQIAVNNLIAEGYNHLPTQIIFSGDVMFDAALYYQPFAHKPDFTLPPHFILTTIHRAENTDNASTLLQIFNDLEEIARRHNMVLPLHPRTKNKLDSLHYDFSHSAITFIPPVGYLEMLFLINNCSIVMTDSGGLQKDAFFSKKYCITLRTETEWRELVNNGYNFLSHNTSHTIIDLAEQLISKSFDHPIALYGDGNASKLIVSQLIQ